MKLVNFPLGFQLIMAVVIVQGFALKLPAQEFYGDVNTFKANNPDGKKYEFAKTYINSLQYLVKNEQRADTIAQMSFEEFSKPRNVMSIQNDLVEDNLNLRIARNLLQPYFTAGDNKLITKVADIFIGVCNDQISVNNEERALLDAIHQSQIDNTFKDFDIDRFLAQQEALADKRKEINKGLLEASLYVNKVLISDKENLYGELDKLGITQEQRHNLIQKLNDFDGDEFKGELRAGQSFVQGSIAAIRVFLEDFRWNTLDG